MFSSRWLTRALKRTRLPHESVRAQPGKQKTTVRTEMRDANTGQRLPRSGKCWEVRGQWRVPGLVRVGGWRGPTAGGRKWSSQSPGPVEVAESTTGLNGRSCSSHWSGKRHPWSRRQKRISSQVSAEVGIPPHTAHGRVRPEPWRQQSRDWTVWDFPA